MHKHRYRRKKDKYSIRNILTEDLISVTPLRHLIRIKKIIPKKFRKYKHVKNLKYSKVVS